MKLKKILITALLINFAILAIGLGYYYSIPADISIETDSYNYYPGDVIILKFKANREVKHSSVSLEGQETRLFETGINSGTWIYRGLIGIPLNCSPGENTIRVTTRFFNNKKYLNLRTVNIKKKAFAETHIASLSRNREVMKTLREESRVTRQIRSKLSGEKLWEGKFIIPVRGRFSSPYGQIRTYGKRKIGGRHRGIDIAAPEGRSIKAANNGVISMAAKFKGIGNTILIDHGHGVYSIYMHMSRFKVKRTDPVRKGDIIGTVGSTGQSTGPHLHWGIYVNSIAVNPLSWTEREIQ